MLPGIPAVMEHNLNKRCRDGTEINVLSNCCEDGKFKILEFVTEIPDQLLKIIFGE
ncbi:hypothetical protein D3C86_2114120 [compost metagenome]